MGLSSDGILIWGIAYDDEDFQFEYDYEKDEELSERHPGIEFGIHCSYDYPMRYVAPSDFVVRAYRGTPRSCQELFFALERGDQDAWRDQLHAAVLDAGLEWREPELTLISVLG